MKKTVFAFAFVVMMVGLVFAQRGSTQASFGNKKVEIEYGTPSLQGRDMLSKLPVGGSWRMGMNAATMLTSDAGLDFGGKMVAAGSYRLTAKRVGENDWHLVIDTDGGATEVPLLTKTLDQPVEKLSIELEAMSATKGEFRMAWGTLGVSTTFTVK